MLKRFKWQDLQKLVDNFNGITSREAMAVAMILAGEKIDISVIPAREGFRTPYQVKRTLEKLFADHEGISNNGDIYWIADLYGKK